MPTTFFILFGHFPRVNDSRLQPMTMDDAEGEEKKRMATEAAV